VIGSPPTGEETRRFLDSADPQKRSLLIDELLNREEYAAYWTLLWSDLLRVDASALGPQASYAITRWLRRQFAENRPYDEMVQEILTVRGSVQSEGPAAFYATLAGPKQMASATSQLFLGVRIECAECHHHPFERWSQRDYVAYASFFTSVGQKTLPDRVKAIRSQNGSDLPHPRTKEKIPAAGLGESKPATETEPGPRGNLRPALAEWMTGESNPFFARAIANRLWAHYLGRGLVEPVDDIRASNPARNEPLLAALEQHLREVDYDLKAFTRTVMNSRVYQLSTETNPTNASDEQLFSHATFRPLPAEVLLDTICQATDCAEKFQGFGEGAKAIELWDSRTPSYFLRIFGRPERTTVCECERGDLPSISQSLHLMNSPKITQKVEHRQGRARRLADSDAAPVEVVESLYLNVLNRRPSNEERQLMLAVFQEPGVSRRTAVEDVLWTLMNTKEFLFNH